MVRRNTKNMLEVMSRGENKRGNTEEKMETVRNDEIGEKKHKIVENI